jgi:predicted phosphodiesterase
MRSLIITDLHHKHPQEIVESAMDLGIEKIVCLGDIETPQILDYLLKLKIKKRIIIGDHEYHHSHGMEIFSSSMKHNCEYYWNMWSSTPAGKFVLEYGSTKNTRPGKTKGIKVVDKIGDKKICYVHGSLLEKEPMHPGMNGIMWGRLLCDYYDEKKISNFRVMQNEGYSILFRGHDHTNSVHTFIEEIHEFKPNKVKIESKEKLYETIIQLDKDRLNMVTVGAFERGNCCIFDEDKWTARFTSERFLKHKE